MTSPPDFSRPRHHAAPDGGAGGDAPPRDPAHRRAWVIYQLALRGLNLAELARRMGVKRHTLYQVFRRPYPRGERVIAEALGLDPAILFPERYERDQGTRSRRTEQEMLPSE